MLNDVAMLVLLLHWCGAFACLGGLVAAVFDPECADFPDYSELL